MAAVAIRFARPKEMPVVTATWEKEQLVSYSSLFFSSLLRSSIELAWPRRLNHPVSHAANGDQRGGASIPAQKYGPPLVGIADTISAMAMATSIVKKETMIQLTEITAGQQEFRPST